MTRYEVLRGLVTGNVADFSWIFVLTIEDW